MQKQYMLWKANIRMYTNNDNTVNSDFICLFFV